MIIISSNTKIFLHAKMQSNYFFRKANPLIISSVLSVSMLECLRILSCLHKKLSSLAQLGVLALLGFFESTGEEDGWSLELPLIRIFNSFVQTLCALHLTLLYLNISCSFHILRTGRSTVIAFVRQSTPAMQHNQSSSDFGPPYTEKAFLIHHIIFHMAYVFVSLFLFFFSHTLTFLVHVILCGCGLLSTLHSRYTSSSSCNRRRFQMRGISSTDDFFSLTPPTGPSHLQHGPCYQYSVLIS